MDDSEKRSRGRCSWVARKPQQQGFLLKGGEVMVLKWEDLGGSLIPPCHDQMYE